MSTSSHKGLTGTEVNASRQQHGSNIAQMVKPHVLLHTLKEIVLQPMILLLICAASVYFILGQSKEAFIMLFAIAIVTGISIYQENKSRSAINALRKLSSPQAKVIRDGQKITIPTGEIVIDDLIVIEDGNVVPADAEIIEAHDFTVNEGILTGESLPVFKNQTPPENIIFQGTMVMTGSGIAKVTAIGSQTSFGKIGQSLQEIEITKTPLQIQIENFVTKMAWTGAGAFLLVWGVNYYLSKDLLHGLLHGLTMAMSVIPEEIPVAFSTFMALGAYQLYKRKVITRSTHTVEALGAASVICTDKTGTLTENSMKLTAIYDFTNDKTYDYSSAASPFNIVLEYAMWASEIIPFDAMEKAIHELYTSSVPSDKRPDYALVHEYPLSGNPPIMTHVFSDHKSSPIIAVKGSIEGVLKQCKLTAEQIQRILDKTSALASKGYRVLGVAKSNSDIKNLPHSQHDFVFDFLGLLAFNDPPKKNIQLVLEQFYDAGVKVKMITGDYTETVVALGDQIHFKGSSVVMTGTEVMKMNQPELLKKVEDVNIFSRMFPEAKLKVIEALKANGEIVAMTGDGVNDGPALKASHIGIAMGLRGSEIAKQAASLVLMDDDLIHMVEAIALGRRIYENLKKALQYIISIHIPIILIITIPLLLSWTFKDFFLPIHVIFLELIMGPTCSIVFAKEPIEANSMQKPPRKMTTSLFGLSELSLSIVQGLMITLSCLGLGYYYMQIGHNETDIRTLIYATLIFSNIFLTLVNRSFYFSVITTLKYKNSLLPFILIASLGVFFLSIYVEPVRNLFQFSVLNTRDLVLSMAIAFAGVMWIEIYKWIKRSHKTLES
ncbi:MAG: cation-translocating P-type ATPase [Saprospiraceae bacterium]|uniref:Cation-translocating P-type ATPase n=1 Tax=Candidatus Opimibacter skivensis TaxID=2982028 RepID=A0A9D7XNJ9_9BACT|nr:cation-translocating P-type ATPase [Candidatus Opimibacter skivensis]